jgi:hypothetical protein
MSETAMAVGWLHGHAGPSRGRQPLREESRSDYDAGLSASSAARGDRLSM